jgi:hypothetical protein
MNDQSVRGGKPCWGRGGPPEAQRKTVVGSARQIKVDEAQPNTTFLASCHPIFGMFGTAQKLMSIYLLLKFNLTRIQKKAR